MAAVVDVFTGQGKMHPLDRLEQALLSAGRQGVVAQLRFDPILHGFDIVVGGFLNVLDGEGVLHGKLEKQGQEIAPGLLVKRGQFMKPGLTQGQQPSDFHLHTPAHITELRELKAQTFKLARIAPVQW